MSELIEMVFTECVEWFKDWVATDPPTLVDEWDLMEWLEHEMKEATDMFLSHAFHSARARNDAVMILRALYYEYFLFQQQISQASIKPNPEATERLPRQPQTAQKSAAWHAEARDMLSGHEFGGICVGGPAERNSVLAKKCTPEVVVAVAETEEEEAPSQTVFLTDEDGKLSPFKWGWRYEPVARQLFETCVSHAPVFDGLGRVRHPTLPRLGASPDGLVMGGPRAGRLVEIKCPITREINGSIPIRYYCQMQLQAEVCDVDAVDYIEVQFGAAPASAVLPDIIKKTKQPWIGKVCVVSPAAEALPSAYMYEYSPLFPATEEGYAQCLAWRPVVSETALLLEECVWYVKDWFTTTVVRNRRWWETVGYPAYVEFWKTADEARADGRFKSRPLFLDSESETETEPEPEPEAEKEKDGDEDTAKANSGPVWQGVESDSESDTKENT